MATEFRPATQTQNRLRLVIDGSAPGTPWSDRNVRLRMGLPPVAMNPLEQSLRSWLFARLNFSKTKCQQHDTELF